MDPIEIAVGGWHIGVRADSARTAERLRRLLHAHVTDTGAPLRSNFSLRAPTGRLRRQPGAVYLGGLEVASSTSMAELEAAMIDLLSGLQSVEPPLTHVEMRVFVAGDRAVLIDSRLAGLEHEPALVDLGAVELMQWQPVVDTATGDVVVLPRLPDVAGATEDVSRAARRWAIGAVVTSEVHDDRLDLGSLWARATEDRAGWLDLLRRLEQAGRLVGVGPCPPDELAAHIAAALSTDPTEPNEPGPNEPSGPLPFGGSHT